MPPVLYSLNNGYVSSRDRRFRRPGELNPATGVYYKKGDTERAHKIGGRTSFDTLDAGAAKVLGVHVAQFDSGGTDRLLAYSGTSLESATPGLTGTFAELIGSLDSSATHMTVAHYDDRQYWGNAYDTNRVIENDGTTYNMGMQSPVEALTATASDSSGTASTNRASGEVGTGGFTDEANGRDGDDSGTFAYATLSAAGTAVVQWEWSANADANRVVYVKYAVAGAQDPPSDSGPFDFGKGGAISADYQVSVKIEKSEDDAGAWTTISNNRVDGPITDKIVQSAVTANSDLVRIRVTFTYHLGTAQATCRVYDVRITDGSSAATFSTTTGLYYAYSEWDDDRGRGSPKGPVTDLVTLSTQNQVALTLPSSAQNSTATHWRIWRTTDGGSQPQGLGLIGEIPIAETSFIDDFTTDKDTEAVPVYPLVRVSDPDSNATLYFDRDVAPPSAKHMNVYEGSVIMTNREKPRVLRWTEPGRPESSPEINLIENFDFPEHDILVGTMNVSESLIVLAQDLVLRVDGLPSIINGQFNASDVNPLRGQPGCVGIYAFTSFSVQGESRGAWVSRFGIHITNGFSTQRITSDLDWESDVDVASLGSAVLRFDQERDVLIFAYDSDGGGTNDRFLLFHMSPEHQKQGIGPKIGGPHYGSINCLASAVVGGVNRVYSGHVSDGNVYVEDNGATDASSAYSGTQVPMILGVQDDFEGRNGEIHDGGIEHTNFGSGQTCTLSFSTVRDSDGEVRTQTVSKTPSLHGDSRSDFFIGRSGSRIDFTITHTGAAQDGAALCGVRLNASRAGRAGTTLD